MAHEIERKFLVIEPPADLESYPNNEIVQGYLEISDDGTEERIRRKGQLYTHTVKSGQGLIREEAERGITEEEFMRLWPKTDGKRVEKVRYDIEYEGYLVELDAYEGALEGLVVAEVEFESEEQSSGFKPPVWFGRDITDDQRYKNKNLALYGMPLESNA